MLSKEELQHILDALNALGTALGNSNHLWTDKEHRYYDKASKLLSHEIDDVLSPELKEDPFVPSRTSGGRYG
jgi:hypothetical protein